MAKPKKNATGALDLKVWECAVPGKEKTIWEGGLFKLEMQFPDGESYHSAWLEAYADLGQSTLQSHQSVRISIQLYRPVLCDCS